MEEKREGLELGSGLIMLVVYGFFMVLLLGLGIDCITLLVTGEGLWENE